VEATPEQRVAAAVEAHCDPIAELVRRAVDQELA
jgi:hypothetical protein